MARGTPRTNPASTRLDAPASTISTTFHAISAQGHADANFLRALRDGVSGDAVQSNSGQQQRHDPE